MGDLLIPLYYQSIFRFEDITTMERNPNEAIAWLKKVQQFTDNIINYNVVSIETSSTSRTRTKVINLKDLSPEPSDFSGGKKVPTNFRVSPIVHSQHSITLPNIPAFDSGATQALVRSSQEYRQLQSLYQDVNAKAIEWKTLWAANPHMKKLHVEIDVTKQGIKEALLSLRRKMNSEAKKYCPTKLQSNLNEIFDYIKQIPADKHLRNMEINFPNGEDTTVVQYRTSFKLQNLKSLNKVIPNYIVVVTYVVDLNSKTALGHITTMMELDPNAELGASFKTVPQALDALNTYLDLDKLDTDINVLPFPPVNITKESIGLDTIYDVDLDPDTDRLTVRTNQYLDDEGQEEILMRILRYIPDYLKRHQLRIDVGIEAYARIATVNDRHKKTKLVTALNEQFPNINIRHIGATASSDNDVYIKTASFKNANQFLPQLKRSIVKNGLAVKEANVRNVFTFAVGAGKRSDIRGLRAFIESISEDLSPEQVLKVRRSLGV